MAMLPALPVAAQPEAYPGKPITIVVAYPPGGSTDLTGRTLAAEMSKKLGVPVVIENIGGAAGAIGAQKVVHAAPDGYTLLVGANNEIAINRLVSASVKYDIKDFTPLGLIASQPLVLVASQKSGVKSIDQFLSVVKQNPGKFSYGSSGVGSSLHLAGEMVKEQAGLFMTHIPYRGVAPLTNDLLGNNIDFGVYVLSSALPHIRSGKLVPLGTTERQRSAVTPDLPALAENARLKGMDIGTWYVLMGPAHMPAPVVARLKKALNDSLQSPELRKKLEDASSTIAPLNVDMPRFLNAEVAKYKKIVDYARITE
ncbi:MAG: tripartite tricarboxylate transporter substrate binding protein [Polaromonas sp.]|nr:tripartite tricarboxylate transporter substrate binding protein [Polaromonas sp.]MDP2452045.1 tripartite tricarboxylate transporter substrate binding protein [Polaromonas sp.]MDP3250247.1 tripartite tricarboxylate transporter substrate binding protein [Polaromonas sp.]MDP3756714.1 tripartite tricarboxylate transporter substrate binding protein [Polaromonas sp.]MDP3825379.1 tripartite tricarboxylate transporter substrate binding protein [Polaromonas sp.]